MRFLLLSIGSLLLLAFPSAGETIIEVEIKGFDDGIVSSTQQDYSEAVLFAKREAIERAGVSISSVTTSKDFLVQSDVIEAKADAVLLPGYKIIDIGYQADGAYLVILQGSVQPINNQMESTLVTGLNALAETPAGYQFDLGEIGVFPITKAYFVSEDQFAIHYDFRGGLILLDNVKQGVMRLNGTYQTNLDSGNVTLDFNADGSASGKWFYLLSEGPITIGKIGIE